jgi:hypothetical protein
VLGLDLVVGPPPPATVLEGGGPSLVPNGTIPSWLGQAVPLGSVVTGTIFICLLDTLCGFVHASGVGGAGSGGRTHSTTNWNGLGRWWRSTLVPNGTIPHGWSISFSTWVWSHW